MNDFDSSKDLSLSPDDPVKYHRIEHAGNSYYVNNDFIDMINSDPWILLRMSDFVIDNKYNVFLKCRYPLERLLSRCFNIMSSSSTVLINK